MSENLALTNIRLDEQNKALNLKLATCHKALKEAHRFILQCQEFYNPTVGEGVLVSVGLAMAELEVKA